MPSISQARLDSAKMSPALAAAQADPLNYLYAGIKDQNNQDINPITSKIRQMMKDGVGFRDRYKYLNSNTAVQ